MQFPNKTSFSHQKKNPKLYLLKTETLLENNVYN